MDEVSKSHQEPHEDDHDHDHDEEEDDDDDSPVGPFKVAVETLLQELFVVVGDQSRSPAEIGAGLEPNEVWCWLGPFGVHGRERKG